jgi:hypothetical protein
MTKLYRCKTPSNALCPCGKVARALDEAGIEKVKSGSLGKAAVQSTS